jgi:hypothetical protein
VTVEFADMRPGEYWILRPVDRGYCRYESLKDGSLTLCDIALMNEMIDVVDENQARQSKAMSRGK